MHLSVTPFATRSLLLALLLCFAAACEDDFEEPPRYDSGGYVPPNPDAGKLLDGGALGLDSGLDAALDAAR